MYLNLKHPLRILLVHLQFIVLLIHINDTYIILEISRCSL